MEYPITKIIAFIIFIIVLLILISFTGIPTLLGKQINLQQQLRDCCNQYVRNGCPEFSAIDYSPILGISCADSKSLRDLVVEADMDYQSLKNFCYCP